MGLTDRLSGKKIFLDTAPVICYIEKNQDYDFLLKNLFELNAKGEVLFSTSTLTLIELLVVPLRLKRYDLVEQYKSVFSNSRYLEILPLDIKTSQKAAELRANYNFKTPDSIQLATAIVSNSDIFLTNDKKLKQNEIETIVLSELR